MQLPQDTVLRKELKKYLDEGVRELAQIDSCKEQLKVIKEDIKEKFDISASDSGKLIEGIYNESKAQQQFEKAEELIHNIEIMQGVKP